MNQDDSMTIKERCAKVHVYPVDMKYFGRHFWPAGPGRISLLFEILLEMLECDVLVFDGRDFFMASWLRHEKIEYQRRSWSVEEVLGARCFDRIRDQARKELKGSPLSQTPPQPTIALYPRTDLSL